MQKTIFITGASSGLGKAAANLFHSKGWTVIATMRNPGKEKELNALESVHLYPMDVTDAAQVKATIAAVLEKFEVDVVFNNAGYGMVGGFEAYRESDIHPRSKPTLSVF